MATVRQAEALGSASWQWAAALLKALNFHQLTSHFHVEKGKQHSKETVMNQWNKCQGSNIQ